MATVVRMPEVLAGVSEAAIATWLVAVGEQIEVGSPLAEIETEKAVVEYASEIAGTVLELLADEGAGVAVGAPIVVIGAAGESAPVVPVTGDEPASPQAGDEPPVDAQPVGAANAPASENQIVADTPASPPGAADQRQFVSPLVRRLARERGIDLSDVSGTGPNGRIVRRDLEALAGSEVAGLVVAGLPAGAGGTAAVAAGTPADAGGTAAGAAATPAGATAPPGDVEEIPVTPMRRAIARRLTESTTTVPHFFLSADCRVERLLRLREEANDGSGVRISINDVILKAVAGALRAVPDANATWGDTVIRRHRSVDIGFAVAVDGGLVTPVIRDANRLTLSEISRTAADLTDRARAGRIRQAELEGGTFSISNLGMYGTREFSAIINPPHAGILAVGAVRQAPVVEDGALVAASVMTITLSADHRVMDGALAAQLLAAIVERIENPVRALI